LAGYDLGSSVPETDAMTTAAMICSLNDPFFQNPHVYRVARFFLVQHTKTGENFQMAINYKIYQMAGKGTKWQWNIPASSIARTSKIWIFGLKISHLATLDV
jgi:hypothetical protein